MQPQSKSNRNAHSQKLGRLRAQEGDPAQAACSVAAMGTVLSSLRNTTSRNHCVISLKDLSKAVCGGNGGGGGGGGGSGSGSAAAAAA